MMGRATWHGELEGVELTNGQYLRVAPVALGSVEGAGLVTAASREMLLSGRYLPKAGGRYRRLAAVFYRRRRTGPNGGLRWRHELSSTAFADGPRGPVFVSLSPGRAARVCASLPGDFICEG